MRYKDVSFDDPRENILYDDVLLEMAEHHDAGEFLRFWESPVYFIVLGRVGKIEEDVDERRAKEGGVIVLRRSSGGGTVLQGPGCLNYTLVLSKEKTPMLNDLRRSYAHILSKIIEALKKIGVSSDFHPISDIALINGNKKISGNAQKRGRTYILHHGTLLYDFNLDLIAKYLRMPKDIPDYRANRKHQDFVANIHKPLSAIKEVLREQFEVKESTGSISIEEKELLEKFLETKIVTQSL